MDKPTIWDLVGLHSPLTNLPNKKVGWSSNWHPGEPQLLEWRFISSSIHPLHIFGIMMHNSIKIYTVYIVGSDHSWKNECIWWNIYPNMTYVPTNPLHNWLMSNKHEETTFQNTFVWWYVSTKPATIIRWTIDDENWTALGKHPIV